MFIKHNKNVIKRLLVAIAVATSSGVAMAASNLTAINADYAFTYDNKYKGSATRVLTQSGNVWNYKVDAKVAGVANAKQRSTFTVSGNNIIPTSASMTYKVFGLGRTHKLAFTNNGKSIISTYRGKSKSLSSAYPAFDDLSLEAQIRKDLISGNFTGNYYMAKKNKVERTPFKKVGNYKITVPAGTFDTVRVDRIHDDNDRSTSFWLAPSLNYLPIKVSQNNDGKKMEMSLTKLR